MALVFLGSFVNKLSDPMRGTPAIAVFGTVAVTVKFEVVCGGTIADAGLTENADPTVVADTDSGDGPVLDAITMLVVEFPHGTVTLMAVAEKLATGGLASDAWFASEVEPGDVSGLLLPPPSLAAVASGTDDPPSAWALLSPPSQPAPTPERASMMARAPTAAAPRVPEN
jgi:hypothetical protein